MHVLMGLTFEEEEPDNKNAHENFHRLISDSAQCYELGHGHRGVFLKGWSGETLLQK